jgi:hypothetical protein
MSRLPECNELPPGEHEIARGVVVERRAFLFAGVAALLGAGSADAPAAVPPALAEPPTATLDLNEFVRTVQPWAERLVTADRPDEPAYLRSVMRLLPQVNRLPDPRFRPVRPGLAVHPVYRFRPLLVVQLRLEPGATIGLHDHPGCNGVLCGVEGQVRVRTFDFEDAEAARRSGRTFRVRRTAERVLTAGRCSAVGRAKDPLHDLTAGPDGARLLDVFTLFHEHGRSADIALRDRPQCGNSSVFEAAWAG